jgi:hypothetical protein
MKLNQFNNNVKLTLQLVIYIIMRLFNVIFFLIGKFNIK